MIEKKENIEVVFILSHLRDNTTSAERYKSFIRGFLSENYPVRIIEFDYPWKNSTWMGHEVENTDHLGKDIADNLIITTPTLNPLQRFIFFLFSTKKTLIAKTLHIFYQLLYGRDINHPGNKCIPSVLGKKEKGYIIVSGGPFGIFSYAENLAKKLNYNLVLDYRDPWTYGYQFIDTKNFIYRLKVKLNRGKEYNLLSQANLITTVSGTLKNFYPQEFQHKIKVIANGSTFTSHDENYRPKIFNIVYAGTVYYNQLIDDIFFEAVKAFLINKEPSTIRLQFIGSYYNQDIKNKLADFDLLNITEITKRLKKEEVITYFNEASIFLHLKYGDKSGVITSKQADYLAFRKPILLPVSDNGDIAESIINNNAGYVCTTVEENVAILESLYAKFQRGESLLISQSEEMLLKNAREYIAKEFVDLVLKS